MKADAHHIKRIQNGERVSLLESQGLDRGEIAAMVGLSRRYVGQLLVEHQAREIQRRNRPGVDHEVEQRVRLHDVATDPGMQQMIARLGAAISDINAASIDRTQYVLGVASVVRAARLR